jgi:amidase
MAVLKTAVILLLCAGCATRGSAALQPRQELDIAHLHRELDSGRTSVLAVELRYAARIEVLDARGPSLRSVLELNPDAHAIAAELDTKRAERGKLPLYGVPILLKDNIDTADRMLTTAGSLALVDSRPGRDAFIVQRLRAKMYPASPELQIAYVK